MMYNFMAGLMIVVGLLVSFEWITPPDYQRAIATGILLIAALGFRILGKIGD